MHLLCRRQSKKLDKHGKEEYHYNQKNQLVSRSWSGGNTAYAYDLQGNLLTATGTEGRTAFSYNAFNQQTAVAMPNGNRLESRYDAEYLRAGMTQNGSITSFSYYNGELLAESSPDGDTISRYILGYGVAAGWNREKEGYHPYHLDEQNSTAYITGINGEIENHYQYDAFGVVQTHQEKIHNRILYTGQQYDQSSGQYYLRARYYNPVVGRFLQEDVYRGDGLNLYAYCANNPVVYYDPSGYNQKPCKEDASTDEGKSGAVEDGSDVIRNNLVDNIKGIRNQMPNSDLSKRGNMAAADVDIAGIKRDFVAHSRINGELDKGADIADFSYLKSESERIFTSYVVDRYPRYHDTEAKILEDIASQITDPNISGKITLYSELPCCQSCSNIILEFKREFPNIQLNVFVE